MTVTDSQLSQFAAGDDDPEPREYREMAAELLRRRREETIRENAFIAEVQRRVRAEDAVRYYKGTKVSDSLRSAREQDSLNSHPEPGPRGPWDMP